MCYGFVILEVVANFTLQVEDNQNLVQAKTVLYSPAQGTGQLGILFSMNLTVSTRVS